MKEVRKTILNVAAAAAMVSLVPAGAAFAKDTFIFGVPSVINEGVANIVFAQELGYFDQENMEVDMVPVAGSAVSIPLTLSNKIQTTSASLEPLTLSRIPGKPNFPMVFAYNMNRNYSWEFVVLENSPLKSVRDFRNKTIGVTTLTVGVIYMDKAMLKSEGIPEKEVTFQPVGFGVQAFEALRTGQIDVLNLWDTMHATLEATGTKIRRIPFPDAYQNLSSHGLFYTNAMIEEKPKMVAGFGRAMTKGTVACEANPENCMRAFYKRHPNLMPAGTKSMDEAVKRAVPILQAKLRSIVAPAGKYGQYEKRDWDLLINALKLGGQLPEDINIPYDTLYTNRFVEEYNRFDASTVISQAKAYR